MRIIYDIETVKNSLAEKILLSQNVTPPANIKDPKKIEAAIVAKRHKILEKAALSWPTAQIVSIACQEVSSGKKSCFFGEDEKELLCDFFDYLSGFESSPRMIGKNNSGFDDGMVVGRAIVHDIGLVPTFRIGDITDIDKAFGWGKTGNPHVVQLGIIAKALSFDDKSGKGTDVQNWFDAFTLGDISKGDTIREYNMRDVEITAEFYRRWDKIYSPNCEPSLDKDTIDATF